MVSWLFAAIAAAAPQPAEPPASLTFEQATGPRATGRWWTSFGDPALEALLAEALGAGGNGDWAAAAQRVRLASGVQVQRFAPLLPTASFEAGLNAGPCVGSIGVLLLALAEDPSLLGAASSPNAQSEVCLTTSAMLVAGWQLDVFGRNGLSYAAQTHEVSATRADRDATELALGAAIAQAWYDLVLSDRQVALLEEQLAAQSELLELVELRYAQGGIGALDVLQQRQQVASTRAMVPTARAGRDARQRTLAAMVGRGLDELPQPAADLPDPEALPGVGTPAELVSSRPDLAAGLQRARAARDARAASQLGLAPTLRLSAQAGWNGVVDPDDPDQGTFDVWTQTPTWGAGVALSVPLFGGGVQHGRIRQARATESIAVATYDQAVLNAIAEVDAAIRVDEEQRLRRDAVRTQAQAARAAYDESRHRYLEGLDPYLAVLAAQAAHQAAELALLQARRDAVVARVQLLDALGQLGPTENAP